jgi:hypothetical protein
MAQKWNLQDIRPAGSEKQPPQTIAPVRKSQDIAPRMHREQKEVPSHIIDTDIESIEVIDGNTAKRKRVVVTAITGLIILTIGFTVNIFLGGAEVKVNPRLKDVSVQAAFTSYTKPQVNELGYELLSLEAEGEKQVQAKGKETVSVRAEGKIFVYNAKSTSPQRLIKNTRFESADGLIYRIKESIEVPAVTKDAKGNTVPGSVVADVFADGTGEQYNLQPARFTVPGLKGTEQFDVVYGESTSPFTGGFEGEKYIIDEAELETAKQTLHLELRDKLLAQVAEKRPAGFVLYDDSITFTYNSLPATEYGDSLATIKESARLQVPMFNELEFAKYLAEKSIPDYTGEPVTLFDPSTLSFEYTGATTSVSDIGKYTELEFELTGTTKIVWKFDEKELQSKLAGIKKTDATKVFSDYTSISHAQAEVRPFWKTSFPKNINEIKIITELNQGI